jgi:hypothetical protein
MHQTTLGNIEKNVIIFTISKNKQFSNVSGN